MDVLVEDCGVTAVDGAVVVECRVDGFSAEKILRRKNFVSTPGLDLVAVVADVWLAPTLWLRLHAAAAGYTLYACSGTSRAVLFGGALTKVLVISACLMK